VPVSFWRRDEVEIALARREVGRVLRAYLAEFPERTQTQLALLTAHDRSDISNFVRGTRDRPVSDIDVLVRIANGLEMPDGARVLLGLAPADAAMSSIGRPHQHEPSHDGSADGAERPPTLDGAWRDTVRSFWRLATQSRVDLVCSEIPESERPAFASPSDRNYLRYARFADLDSLVYARTRLAQTSPGTYIRDFAPSEYHGGDTDTLVVIGGPPWNSKYREFLPHLPYYFEPHEAGEDDPLVVPQLRNLWLKPRWTVRGELLDDLAVFTRLTLAQGTVVFLLGGCLTLGVLASAKCFLEGRRGARNVQYITELVGDSDFVLVNEARRVGGITDAADFGMAGPLLVLARGTGGIFGVVVDNTRRYATPASPPAPLPAPPGR
jgi:hypothetical protein